MRVNQVTVRFPIDTLIALDVAADEMRRSRADVIRIAVDRYLIDRTDISLAIQALQDPEDESLDWEVVRAQLLR